MANTYPTAQYPLGSTEVKVLFNNASNLDDAVNGEALTWVDRFGDLRKSMAGIEEDANNALLNTGFEFIGDYDADGPLTLTRLNQTFSKDGEFWRPGPSLVLPFTTTGNWAADEPNFVSNGDASLRAALAASPGSGLVGWDINETYTTGSVGYQLFSSLPAFVNARAFGVKGDGVTDDTMAIQAARDSGFPILFSAGTFMLSLAQTIMLEGGVTDCAIKGKCVFRGAGAGRTIFKLKDNESTDGAPKYFNLISINTLVDGLLLEDITFDLNGQNNTISPNRGIGIYNYFNCAALMVSGSVATAGADARLTNSRILNCEVINSPGVSCIVLAQTNTNSGGGGSGALLGNNIEIAGCRFYNNGIDTNDHSSIYMWANNVRVHGCTFDHPVMSNGVRGPYAAAELHGSHNWFQGNTINNYPWGVYVASNYTELSRGQYVLDNDMFVAIKAISVVTNTAAEPGMTDLIFSRNRIWLSNDFAGAVGFDGSDIKKCVDIRPAFGNVYNVIVSDNVIVTFDAYSAYAVMVGAIASGATIDNVAVINNTISGFSIPIVMGIAGGGLVVSGVVRGNTLADIRPNVSTPVLTIGVIVAGANGRLNVSDNDMRGTSGHPYFGVYLTPGSVANDLHMDNNATESDTTVIIQDSINITGRRSGRQALQFTALPTQSTWRIGDEIYNSGPSEQGVAASKYVIMGWVRLTNGSTNIATTDWVQRRVLTGN